VGRLSLPALALVLGVYGALFAQTRGFDFVWGDADAIRDSAVFDLPLGRMLRTTEHTRMDPSLAELHGIALTHEAYRPLLIASHAVDIALFGRVPGPMHLHNVALGLLAILAVFWLAARLFAATTPALLVTAIFALHPLHVEPLCFLCARADPLAGLLTLVAAALVVEIAPPGGEPRPRRHALGLAVAAGLAFTLSLFAKEANVLLPLALAGFGLATRRLRAWGAGLIALVVALPIYAVVRALVIAHAAAATHGSRIVQAAVALPAIMAEYARSFLLPFDISISRPVYLSSLSGWAIAAVIVAVLIVTWRRAISWRPAIALVAGALAWSVLLTAPAAIAVFSEAAVADRYAYLPLFGFAVAVVALGRQAAQRSLVVERCAVIAAALFLVLCVFVSAREIPAWAKSGTLYAHAVAVEPDSSGAHNRLGRWLGENGAWGQAVVEFEKAAAAPDAGDRVLNNLGVGYLNVGRPADAEAVLRRAVSRSHETSFHGWYNLGTAQHALGNDDAACDSYRRALELSPGYAHARADYDRYCRR
jgi:tetratricopeptide (TPR) repeat protein